MQLRYTVSTFSTECHNECPVQLLYTNTFLRPLQRLKQGMVVKYLKSELYGKSGLGVDIKSRRLIT
jgi:hypothetical protein